MFKTAFITSTLAIVMVLSLPAVSGVVSEVRSATARSDLGSAERILVAYRALHGIDPDYLEALSWLGRGALSAGNLELAGKYARETEALTVGLLKSSQLDAKPQLAIALGAAFEVQAQTLSRQGKTGQALSLLRKALDSYGDTSIRARLQKNLNLLALVGEVAPPLDASEYLGPKPAAISELKGATVLIFFWAHWCADCKAEAPTIARLRSEFSKQDLVILAPTQRYGFAGAQEGISPEQEKAYIDQVRQRYYDSLSATPIPLSKKNFDVYGASTTPTLVLVAPNGHVALYHPGAMSFSELRTAVEHALASSREGQR